MLLSANPEVHRLLQEAPQVAGMPLLVNVPAFAVVMAITWLLLRGARESATANRYTRGVLKLIVNSLPMGSWPGQKRWAVV